MAIKILDSVKYLKLLMKIIATFKQSNLNTSKLEVKRIALHQLQLFKNLFFGLFKLWTRSWISWMAEGKVFSQSLVQQVLFFDLSSGPFSIHQMCLTCDPRISVVLSHVPNSVTNGGPVVYSKTKRPLVNGGKNSIFN